MIAESAQGCFRQLCAGHMGREPEKLFLSGLLRAAPHHSRLLPGTKTEFSVERRTTRAQPKQLDAFEPRMVENALYDVRTNALLLVGLVDDNVPDRGPVHKICQYAAKPHELIAIPGAQRDVGMAQHILGIVQRAIFRPRGLMKKPQQL